MPPEVIVTRAFFLLGFAGGFLVLAIDATLRDAPWDVLAWWMSALGCGGLAFGFALETREGAAREHR